ncbi:sialoadhesin-like [Alosa pseudoharengus]|uniref:sialoadhesin-like n=1 Tax=Alosa pseudoharengus TaxID=34774 RepID=UPI003F89D14A
MPCSIVPPAGQYAIHIFWLINAKKNVEPTDLAVDPSYAGRVKYFWDEINYNLCTLKLSDVKLTDNAEYRARIITGRRDKWQSCSAVRLSVTALTVWVPETVVEGNEVKLNCRTTCRLKEKPTVIWRKNGEELPGEQTGNSELLLQRVSTEDEGEYSCALKGHEGHPSTPVKLNVMYGPKNTLATVSPSGEILERKSVTLTCSSDANPPVQSYSWYRNNSTAVSAQQVYSISAVSSEHTGYYYCQAQNTHGHSDSTAIHLDVLYPPKGTSASLYHTGDLKEGSSVTLTCSSDANPPVENYTWYRKTGDKTTEVDSGETITFTLNTTTAGLYYCEAKNRIASHSSHAVKVYTAGFGWQRAVLFVFMGLVITTAVITTLGLGLIYWRRRKVRTTSFELGSTDKNTENDVDKNNDPEGGNPGAVDMSPVYESQNPNTIQPDAVYQSLNPHTIQPDAVYQSLNPNTIQHVEVYQSLDPNTTQPDAVYQSLNPKTMQHNIDQILNPNTT